MQSMMRKREIALKSVKVHSVETRLLKSVKNAIVDLMMKSAVIDAVTQESYPITI
jgi:hypothetical protein